MAIEAVQFDLIRPDHRTFEAVRLMRSEVYLEGGEEAVLDYLFNPNMQARTHYSLVRDEWEVLAAAAVTHHEDLEGRSVSHVDTIAVQEHERGKGYGRQLMRYVAMQTLAVGDSLITLQPHDVRFYHRIGFQMDEDGIGMHAKPEDVLA
jgi:GNAT superfamily N-acetyltransferase